MSQATTEPLNFDATQDYKVLVPAGTYLCGITDAEVRKSNADVEHMVFTVQILEEGPYKGCNCMVWVNYWADNLQHRAFAHQRLTDICRAAGISCLKEMNDLVGSVFQAKWGISKNGKFNQIEEYAPLETTSPVKARIAGQQDTW